MNEEHEKYTWYYFLGDLFLFCMEPVIFVGFYIGEAYDFIIREGRYRYRK